MQAVLVLPACGHIEICQPWPCDAGPVCGKVPAHPATWARACAVHTSAIHYCAKACIRPDASFPGEPCGCLGPQARRITDSDPLGTLHLAGLIQAAHALTHCMHWHHLLEMAVQI